MAELTEQPASTSEQLEKFIKYCERFPEQYTPEWFNMTDYIGGSEMSDLITAPFALAVRKISNAFSRVSGYKEPEAPPPPINPSKEPYFDADGTYAKGWGTLFEPLHCEYISRKLQLDIKARSISYFEDPYRFSPDGSFIDANGDCGVLEMKAPFVRLWTPFDPLQNDLLIAPHMLAANPSEVPKHYYPQLQSGLRAMPFAKYAFYSEAIYRRVWYNTKIPSSIVKQKVEPIKPIPPLDTGIIGFYHAKGCGNVKDAISLVRNDEYDATILRDILSNLHGSDVYIPCYFTENGTPITTFEELPATFQNLPIYAHMAWGLFGIHSVRVNRDPNYFSNTITNNAQCIVSAVRDVLKNGNPIEALQKCRAHIIDKKNNSAELERCVEKFGAFMRNSTIITGKDDNPPQCPMSQLCVKS